jgi:gamma-glutamylcyclotransferase (GGCT)/AIG2-like uncharacterized protein YtfP
MALFVYGSLMSPRVLACVIGHPHTNTCHAIAKGFHRYRIRDRTYPALCTSVDAVEAVKGVLVLELSKRDVEILDEFEGSDYIRTAIKVSLDDGRQVDAFTYLWAKGKDDPELYGDWSFERDFLPNEETTLRGWGFLG